MKICFRCKEKKFLSEFGVNRSKPDGKNINCKQCIREKTSLQWVRRSQWLAARCKPRKGSPIERIKRALKAGIEGQWELHKATGLTVDQVSDALAELVLDRKEVKFTPVPAQNFEDWTTEHWRYKLAA